MFILLKSSLTCGALILYLYLDIMLLQRLLNPVFEKINLNKSYTKCIILTKAPLYGHISTLILQSLQKKHWSASFGGKTIKIDQVSARALHTSTKNKGSHDVLWSLLWCVECIPYNGRRRTISRLRSDGWSPWSQPQVQWWCWSSSLLGRYIRSHRSLDSASYWSQLTPCNHHLNIYIPYLWRKTSQVIK